MSDILHDSSPACQAPFTDPLPGILPQGGISLLAGAPNVGKTALLAGILRSFRDGGQIFGKQPSPVAGIGYINADRSWARGSGIWFERAGYPEIPQYTMSDDPAFNPKRLRKKHERTDILAAFIDLLKLPEYSLIVVDPIALFLGGNLLNYDDCAVACHEIRAYLRLKRYTMLCTAHSAKIKADKKERYMRLQDQVLGSTAISGFSDTMMYLASPQETGKPYFTFLWHPHSSPAEEVLLTQDKGGLFSLYSGTIEADPDPTPAAVLELFPDLTTPLSFATLQELAASQAISRATLARILRSLVKAGQVEQPAHGLYRRLPVS